MLILRELVFAIDIYLTFISPKNCSQKLQSSSGSLRLKQQLQMSDDSREIANGIAYWNNWCLDKQNYGTYSQNTQTVQRKVILLPYAAASSVILHQ